MTTREQVECAAVDEARAQTNETCIWWRNLSKRRHWQWVLRTLDAKLAWQLRHRLATSDDLARGGS